MRTIKPFDFDEPQGVDFGVQQALPQMPPNPQHTNFAAAIELLQRELLVNREYTRRSINQPKGEMVETLEQIRTELFAPPQADNQAILEQVAHMIDTNNQNLLAVMETTIVHAMQHHAAMAQAAPRPAQGRPEENEDEPAPDVTAPETPSVAPAISSRDRPARPKKQ